LAPPKKLLAFLKGYGRYNRSRAAEIPQTDKHAVAVAQMPTSLPVGVVPRVPADLERGFDVMLFQCLLKPHQLIKASGVCQFPFAPGHR